VDAIQSPQTNSLLYETRTTPHSPYLDNQTISCVKSPALLMNEIGNNEGPGVVPARGDATNRRIFRSMIVAIVLAISASLLFAPWRVSTGLLLGGLLSLVNHYWLITSTTAAFSVLVNGEKPRLSLLQYVLRYAVIGSAIWLAYKFGIASVPALIAGLCSFVVALFAEAFREFYFAIIHREEII
jgi:hypothetical protein